MLEKGGASVRLAGFCRDDKLSSAIAARKPLLLGQSRDAAMLQRIAGTLRATIASAPLSRYFADCSVVMARNLEQLAIACRIKGARPLVYECLDIHHTLVGDGAAAKAVQWVESKLLPQVNLLLTSSPAFVTQHFAQTSLDCRIELIENKLLVDSVESFAAPPQHAPDAPIRIGWFGMLRCARTLAVLREMAASASRPVEILIAGKPSPAIFPDFTAQIAGRPNIEFTGPYTYADLPGLYSRCHFAWTIDWFEEGENSSWLLPNRIYEATAHGVVPIALADIQVGRWLAQHGAGLRVDNADDAGAAIAAMTPERLAELQAASRSVPRRAVLADDGDCRELVELIGSVTAS